MSNPNDPPLDEIQWRSPPILAGMGGLHSNTILFYFAESPFFERTSNNAVIMSQAMNNMSMYHYIQTREAFEGRLKTMSGLEFIVGEEPAETGPGMGTGVWVIRKQTRRKRYQDEDEITVHASFFVVGENIYMAPTLADVLSSRIVSRVTLLQRKPILALTKSLDDDIVCDCKGITRSRKREKMEVIYGPRLPATCDSSPIESEGPGIEREYTDA